MDKQFKPFVRLTLAAEANPILYPLYTKSNIKSPTDIVRYDGLNISRSDELQEKLKMAEEVHLFNQRTDITRDYNCGRSRVG